MVKGISFVIAFIAAIVCSAILTSTGIGQFASQGISVAIAYMVFSFIKNTLSPKQKRAIELKDIGNIESKIIKKYQELLETRKDLSEDGIIIKIEEEDSVDEDIIRKIIEKYKDPNKNISNTFLNINQLDSIIISQEASPDNAFKNVLSEQRDLFVSKISKANNSVDKVSVDVQNLNDNTKLFTVKSTNLLDAKRILLQQKTEGTFLHSVKILDHGSPYTIREVGDNVECAFSNVFNKLKDELEILEKKVISNGENTTIIIKANNESEARSVALKGFPLREAEVKSIILKTKGKKGFLTIGAVPNTYEIDYFRKATVEVVVKAMAKVQGKIGLIPQITPSRFRRWFLNKKVESDPQIFLNTLKNWYLNYNIECPDPYKVKILDGQKSHKMHRNEKEFVSEIISYIQSQEDDFQLLFYHGGIALYPEWD
jgi:hypothetical protein